MDGKRFGVGLVAGLLLGLVIVAASSGLSFGLFGSFSAASYPTGGQVNYSVTTAATSTAATSTAATSTTTAQLAPSTPRSSSNSTGSLVTSVSSTTSGGPWSNIIASLSTPPGPAYSSRVVSIARQPLSANIVIFIPVLLAILLGAVLYVGSRRGAGGTPG